MCIITSLFVLNFKNCLSFKSKIIAKLNRAENVSLIRHVKKQTKYVILKNIFKTYYKTYLSTTFS